MKPEYSKSVVEPVVVNRVAEDAISIRYHVPPETVYYSGGVNYQVTGDVIRVYIARCNIHERCEPMAKSVIPLDKDWEAKAHIPYHGGKLLLVHSDLEEQIYP